MLSNTCPSLLRTDTRCIRWSSCVAPALLTAWRSRYSVPVLIRYLRWYRACSSSCPRCCPTRAHSQSREGQQRPQGRGQGSEDSRAGVCCLQHQLLSPWQHLYHNRPLSTEGQHFCIYRSAPEGDKAIAGQKAQPTRQETSEGKKGKTPKGPPRGSQVSYRSSMAYSKMPQQQSMLHKISMTQQSLPHSSMHDLTMLSNHHAMMQTGGDCAE